MSAARVLFGALPVAGWVVTLLAGTAFAPAAWGQGSAPPDGLMPGFRPQAICFPVTPPPLGRPVLSQTFAPRSPAPTELAWYVNEPFYAPLSSRLLKNALPEKLRQRLDAFRAERETLLAELRLELTRTSALPAEERRPALAALGRRQAGRLAALEASAEQFRSDCVTSENDWSALRDWRLGGTGSRGDSPLEIACVIRAYAYYQPGLSPAQRRLLREITIEVMSGAEDASSAAAAQPFLFFMPEMTRVMLPETISDEVAKKVAAFQTKKSVLKKELFDAVLAGEGATFSFSRVATMRTLANKQAAGFVELETLAEEIREGVAALPELIPSAVNSPLSSALSQRTVSISEERAGAIRDARARIDAIIARVADTLPVRFEYSLTNEGVKVYPMPNYYGGRYLPLKDPAITAVVEEITRVGNEYRTRCEDIIRDYERLRADIAASLGPRSTGLAIDQAIEGAGRAHIAKENGGAYAEYRLAAFEPGLAPAQRRLLFEAALEKLDLPLPRPEYQPVRRPDTW